MNEGDHISVKNVCEKKSLYLYRGFTDCAENENKQYIYSVGLAPESPISLGKSMTFEAAECTPSEDIVAAMTYEKIGTLYDYGICSAFLWLTDSQIVIQEEDPKLLAIQTWNSLTPLFYLSALASADIRPFAQSSVSANALSPEGRLHAIPLSGYGLPSSVVKLPKEECVVLEKRVSEGMQMINDSLFHRGAQALWSYKWTSHPASQMAILWSGIESLLGVQSELSFRLSYEISLFLDLDQEGYKRIKKLYNERSKAVHAREQVPSERVAASANLLKDLLIRCGELGELPDENKLLFG